MIELMPHEKQLAFKKEESQCSMGVVLRFLKGGLMKQFHQQLVKKALFERTAVVRVEKHLTWN